MGLHIIEVAEDGMAQEKVCRGDHILVEQTGAYGDGDVLILVYNHQRFIRRVKKNCVYITPEFVIPLDETTIIGKAVRSYIDI